MCGNLRGTHTPDLTIRKLIPKRSKRKITKCARQCWFIFGSYKFETRNRRCIGPRNKPQQSAAAASSVVPRSSKRDTEHEDSGGDSKRLHSEGADTKYRPTPDREAFNHKTLRLQIQPARYPQMRPQHHVQPLTNPPGHAQEPHERYRCKTTTKPTAATHQPPATETTLEVRRCIEIK